MIPPSDLRLVRLHAAGYGRLIDFTFAPAREPGALIVAPNEAGKTTLASAVFRGLFGFGDKGREELRRPWTGAPFCVELEWSLGEDTTCTIARDFDSQRVTVEWRIDGALDRRWEGEPNPRGRSSDRERYEEELRRLLGFVSPDIFRQTAFVGPVDPGTRPLASELLRLLSGSERADFRTALAEFEAGWYDLTQRDLHDPARTLKHKPRRLEEAAARRADLEARLERARATRAERRAAEEALADTRARLTALGERMADRAAAREALDRHAALRREIDHAEARRATVEADIARFVEWERRVRERTTQLEPIVRALRLPRDFPERVRRIQRLADERDRATSEARDLHAARAAAPHGRWALVLAGLGLATGAAGAALAMADRVGLVSPIEPWGGWAVAGAGLVGLAWGLARWRSRRLARKSLAVRWTSLEAEAARLGRERAALAEPLPFDPDAEGVDLEAEIERFERAHRLRSELDGMQEAHAALGDRQALERERTAIKEESLDVLRLEQRRLVEKHPYLELGPDYERRFADEQKRVEADLERLRAEEYLRRGALADLPATEDDPLRLEAEVARLDAWIERGSLERDAVRLAWSTLTDCKNEFVRVMTQRLQRRIGSVFEEMTDGRYQAVEIDPISLELAVHGVEKRDVPAESLSRGTRDQLYFALRVALLEELAGERALPLVLDDPFLHFDRQRLARVEETLERLGRTHQILLFTHDTRLAGWTFPKQWLPELAGGTVVGASED